MAFFKKVKNNNGTGEGRAYYVLKRAVDFFCTIPVIETNTKELAKKFNEYVYSCQGDYKTQHYIISFGHHLTKKEIEKALDKAIELFLDEGMSQIFAVHQEEHGTAIHIIESRHVLTNKFRHLNRKEFFEMKRKVIKAFSSLMTEREKEVARRFEKGLTTQDWKHQVEIYKDEKSFKQHIRTVLQKATEMIESGLIEDAVELLKKEKVEVIEVKKGTVIEGRKLKRDRLYAFSIFNGKKVRVRLDKKMKATFLEVKNELDSVKRTVKEITEREREINRRYREITTRESIFDDRSYGITTREKGFGDRTREVIERVRRKGRELAEVIENRKGTIHKLTDSIQKAQGRAEYFREFEKRVIEYCERNKRHPAKAFIAIEKAKQQLQDFNIFETGVRELAIDELKELEALKARVRSVIEKLKEKQELLFQPAPTPAPTPKPKPEPEPEPEEVDIDEILDDLRWRIEHEFDTLTEQELEFYIKNETDMQKLEELEKFDWEHLSERLQSLLTERLSEMDNWNYDIGL